jgi:hypothetical protein
VAVVTPKANANGSAQTASATLGVVVAHHDSARPVSAKALLVGCCCECGSEVAAVVVVVVVDDDDDDDDNDDDDGDEGVNDSVAWLRSSRLAGEESTVGKEKKSVVNSDSDPQASNVVRYNALERFASQLRESSALKVYFLVTFGFS